MNHKSTSQGGNSYDCVCRAYRDVIEIMIYKNNRINKVFGCPLAPVPGGIISSDLVLATVEPLPLLGSNADDAVGILYAEIIASCVQRQASDEVRDLVIGFGDIGPKDSVTPADRDELEVVRQLIDATRVW